MVKINKIYVFYKINSDKYKLKENLQHKLDLRSILRTLSSTIF